MDACVTVTLSGRAGRIQFTGNLANFTSDGVLVIDGRDIALFSQDCERWLLLAADGHVDRAVEYQELTVRAARTE